MPPTSGAHATREARERETFPLNFPGPLAHAIGAIRDPCVFFSGPAAKATRPRRRPRPTGVGEPAEAGPARRSVPRKSRLDLEAGDPPPDELAPGAPRENPRAIQPLVSAAPGAPGHVSRRQHDLRSPPGVRPRNAIGSTPASSPSRSGPSRTMHCRSQGSSIPEHSRACVTTSIWHGNSGASPIVGGRRSISARYASYSLHESVPMHCESSKPARHFSRWFRRVSGQSLRHFSRVWPSGAKPHSNWSGHEASQASAISSSPCARSVQAPMISAASPERTRPRRNCISEGIGASTTLWADTAREQPRTRAKRACGGPRYDPSTIFLRAARELLSDAHRRELLGVHGSLRLTTLLRRPGPYRHQDALA